MSELLKEKLIKKLVTLGFKETVPTDKYDGLSLEMYYKRGEEEFICVYGEEYFVHWAADFCSGNDSLTEAFITEIEEKYPKQNVEVCEDCGSGNGVSYIEEPFEYQINFVSFMMYLCEDCYYSRAENV